MTHKQIMRKIPMDNTQLSRLLLNSLGWSWPPLTGRGEAANCLPKEVLDIYKRSDPETRRMICGMIKEDDTIRETERTKYTWEIRNKMIECLIELHYLNLIDLKNTLKYLKFKGDSELIWFKTLNKYNNNNNNNEQKNFGEIQMNDYPIGIDLTIQHPLEKAGIINSKINKNEMKQIQFKGKNQLIKDERYWILGFSNYKNQMNLKEDENIINFNRTQDSISVKLISDIDILGFIWLESNNNHNNPNGLTTESKIKTKNIKSDYRILFQKTCHESNLGLLIWPQYQEEHYDQNDIHQLPEISKIPIFEDDVIQICDGDRLIVMSNNYRSHKVHMDLQISIKFEWASEQIENQDKKWIPNWIQWPNPTKRYSHYLRRPLIYPESLTEDLEKPKENQKGEDEDETEKTSESNQSTLIKGEEQIEEEVLIRIKQIETEEQIKEETTDEIKIETEPIKDEEEGEEEHNNNNDETKIKNQNNTDEMIKIKKQDINLILKLENKPIKDHKSKNEEIKSRRIITRSHYKEDQINNNNNSHHLKSNLIENNSNNHNHRKKRLRCSSSIDDNKSSLKKR